MALIPLFGRGEGYRSRTLSAQKRVNLYLEYETDPDKSDVMMLGTPGLTLFADLGANPVRGARGFCLCGLLERSQKRFASLIDFRQLCSRDDFSPLA